MADEDEKERIADYKKSITASLGGLRSFIADRFEKEGKTFTDAQSQKDAIDAEIKELINAKRDELYVKEKKTFLDTLQEGVRNFKEVNELATESKLYDRVFNDEFTMQQARKLAQNKTESKNLEKKFVDAYIKNGLNGKDPKDAANENDVAKLLKSATQEIKKIKDKASKDATYDDKMNSNIHREIENQIKLFNLKIKELKEKTPEKNNPDREPGMSSVHEIGHDVALLSPPTPIGSAHHIKSKFL